jgi:dTDP-N-acetylfucosamine:lipid II N-acetylfucosaminyltransferase
MIVHIFTQISDYSTEFIRMLTEEFDTSGHVVVFRSKAREKELRGIYNIKMLYLECRKDFLTHMPPLIRSADKLIFHSFPVSRSLFFWYRYRSYMNIAVWSVWGQDAYWFRYCKKNLRNLLYELLRSNLIRRLDKVVCPIKNDYEYIRTRYKTRATYVYSMYPIPTDFSALRLLRKKGRESKTVNIQLGNSANPTNNTLEVIRFLSKYKGAGFRVFCPLSYGDKEYTVKVIEWGRRELGDSFVPMTSFLNRKEYADFIANMDVLIMNHQRQQGLGNIFSYLFLGKKVYIRNDNSAFSFFEEHGIKVFDTQALLSGGDIDQIIDLNEEVALTNMKKTEELISMEKIIPGWKEVLSLYN